MKKTSKRKTTTLQKKLTKSKQMKKTSKRKTLKTAKISPNFSNKQQLKPHSRRKLPKKRTRLQHKMTQTINPLTQKAKVLLSFSQQLPLRSSI